jgi:hypothetical protein
MLSAGAQASPPGQPNSPSSQNQIETAPQRISTASADGLVIPRLEHGPTLDDFLSMTPQGEVARAMAKVTNFVQREPHDGEPVSHPTEAYLGYDDKNLYVVFVCHDDPTKIRAHETRREGFDGEDDDVAIMLDTFHDRRRAYEFEVNPKGIQWDAIWTEESYADTGGNFDNSFDTVWNSKGKITADGYVVWIAIPFRSLRFSSAQDQTWGIVLLREVIRENEKAFWPHISINKEGRLGQAGTASGLSGISPGRNIQLIPYALLNSFHSVDDRGPFAPCVASPLGCAAYQNRDIGGTFGLDGKMILNDSLVLDVTANPDFSQVESDSPQVTVNQRYRVYFPEKRPFFIENADYFRTPIDLFFTRNIVDPDAGIRLTGKAGPYSIGLLSADDRALGLSFPTSGDSRFKTRDYFNIARVSRDIFKQSSIGLIYTDWEYGATNSYNRVGGLDSRISFSPNLTATLQGVMSDTNFDSTTDLFGSAFKADLTYTSRHLLHDSTYNDVSTDFTTVPGFVTRSDIREYREDTAYYFRPKHSPVVSWGPELAGHWTWDHRGLRLDTDYVPQFNIVLKRQTRINIVPYEEFRERLRPQDTGIPGLTQDFHEHSSGFTASTSPLSQLTLGGFYLWGNAINFIPGTEKNFDTPYLARFDQAEALVRYHPINALKIDNTYLFSRLRTRENNANIFNNHIVRSQWNLQLNRQLSLRAILQYNATLTQNQPGNPSPPFTFLPTTKRYNTDFLITYLVHPGTAVYVGYNSNLQNLDPSLGLDENLGGLRRGNRLINDGRLFFVKVSYLFRF